MSVLFTTGLRSKEAHHLHHHVMITHENVFIALFLLPLVLHVHLLMLGMLSHQYFLTSGAFLFKLQADLKGINGRTIESFSKCVALVIKATSLALGAGRELG